MTGERGWAAAREGLEALEQHRDRAGSCSALCQPGLPHPCWLLGTSGHEPLFGGCAHWRRGCSDPFSTQIETLKPPQGAGSQQCAECNPRALKPLSPLPSTCPPKLFPTLGHFCGVQWKEGGNTDTGMGHQDFKTERGRHCCDEGLCWHVPSVSQPRALQGGTAVPTPILQAQTWNSTPGMLLGCSRAVAAALFLSTGSSLSCRQAVQGSHGYPCWISRRFQRFGRADPSCLPLNPSFMAKRCPHPPSLGGCSSSAGPALPASCALLCGVSRKAFKVEKRLISTSLPLGVGALIAHERKIKRNYSSGDTRQRDPGK